MTLPLWVLWVLWVLQVTDSGSRRRSAAAKRSAPSSSTCRSTAYRARGGSPVAVLATVELEKLTGALGAVTLDTGGEISAAQARRLACQHALIPAVMGGASVPLDLGRSSRLFTHHQARAHIIRHRACQADGCDIPAAWCERHHRTPWNAGGPTDLTNLAFLCSHHHHRAHDPTYTTTWTEAGTVTFHRRT